VAPALEAVEADPPWVWRAIEARESRSIFKAVSFLRHAGVHVDPLAFDLPPGIVGRTIYEPDLTVLLNEPGAARALMTLLHEAGHVMSFWRHRRQLPDGCQDMALRERWAFLYGWAVIRLLGIDDLVSKDRWRAFHDGR